MSGYDAYINSWSTNGVYGTQDTPAQIKLRNRENKLEQESNVTGVRTAEQLGGMPFSMYLVSGTDIENSKLDEERKLTLLINPQELSYGSTQIIANSYTRDGAVNSIWGQSQPTLVGSGKTAAFYGAGYGLIGANNQFNTRASSLAYANAMSFIALFRNNGCVPLSNQQITRDDTQGDTNFQEYLDSSSSMANILSQRTATRVVNVLDTIVVSYGGTAYLGSFNTFTLDLAAENPYNMSYSFEFVVSGLWGDKITGHLSNSANRSAGIIIQRQGTSFLESSIGVSLDVLKKQIRQNNPSDTTPRAEGGTRTPPENFQGDLDRAAKFVTLKKENDKTYVALNGLQEIAWAMLPYVNRAYKECIPVGTSPEWYPPVLNSAVDTAEGRKATSLHGQGLAFDFKTNNIPPAIVSQIHAKLKQSLEGNGFQIVYHTVTGKDSGLHFHIEYDPQTEAAKSNKQKFIDASAKQAV